MVFEISIMMKLGDENKTRVDGNEIMEIYNKFCTQHGSVWFSTDSHPKGIGKEKINEFEGAISRGETVEIYFVIGKGCNGTNDIKYKANVISIESDANGIFSPDTKLTPDEYKNENKKIWIKLENLKKFNKLSVEDFIIESTKKELKEAIENSQYHFGYIKRK